MSCPKHDIEEAYVFQYKGIRYECIGENREFDITQFRFAIKDKQWLTVSNRIINQLKWGPNIREIN
tara:strand:- start:394 stop:591 length:198 start_codon:yes stop_codon:yes gene_type:complete